MARMQSTGGCIDSCRFWARLRPSGRPIQGNECEPWLSGNEGEDYSPPPPFAPESAGRALPPLKAEPCLPLGWP
jgi:hypothetical protein